MSSGRDERRDDKGKQQAGESEFRHGESHPTQDSREWGAPAVTHAARLHSQGYMRRSVFNSIRFLSLALMMVAGAVGVGSWAWQNAVAAAKDSSQARPVPVLVELFTSEGCSSCPPADAVLAHLDATQLVPGAQVIVLSEHVTYWNQGGWHDPFSSDEMTYRQRQYGTHLGLSDVYTPQAVVDGSIQMVGSNERKLAQAVAQAAATPKAELTIAEAELSKGAIQFSVHDSNPAGNVLMAALADDSDQSSVLHGENGGHTLRHVAVVRVLQDIGKGAGDGRTLKLKLPSESKTQPVTPIRLVVFLADRKSGHVLAIAEQTIRR
jgi:hypothetical protein